MKLILSIALLLCMSGYSLAGGFIHNNKAVVVQQKVVQFDQRYYQGLDGYYSTLNQIKEERVTESIDELKALNAAYRAQIDLLLKLCAGKNEPPTTQPTPNPSPEVPDVKPPVDDGSTGGGEDTGDEATVLDEEVYNIMLNKCASCHNEKDKKGGLVLINKADNALIWQPLENRTSIHEHVRRVGLEAKGLSPMPPGAPLPDKDVEVFYQWMQEEAKNLREKK